MKITKHGEVSFLVRDKEQYKLTCEKCGCEFEFNHAEIESSERRLNGYATIHCPECNNEIKFRKLDALLKIINCSTAGQENW